jgi:hypothetical protein
MQHHGIHLLQPHEPLESQWCHRWVDSDHDRCPAALYSNMVAIIWQSRDKLGTIFERSQINFGPNNKTEAHGTSHNEQRGVHDDAHPNI